MANGPTMEYKINVVSLMNLLGILGILATALISAYLFVARIDTLVFKVTAVETQIVDVNNRLSTTVAERRAENDALKSKDDFIVKTISDIQTQNIERTVRVETELKNVGQNVQRIETTLQRWIEKQAPIVPR